MKTMEVKTFGLEDLSANEIMAINGGSTACIPWGPIIDWLLRVGAGVLVGYTAKECASKNEEEEVVYDGGELDAAVCVG